MTTTDGLLLLAAGMALGGVFYGGLWWTVGRLPRSRHPVLLTLASFALRAALTVAGLYGLTAGDWRRLGVALAGFLLIRFLLVRRYGGGDAVQS